MASDMLRSTQVGAALNRLWGDGETKTVKYLNQGGSFWVFKLHQ